MVLDDDTILGMADEYCERAATLEYDGRMERGEAEKLALELTAEKFNVCQEKLRELFFKNGCKYNGV